MKNLLIAVLLVVGMTTFAQEKSTTVRKEKMEQISPEQKAELRVKELTLQLDLNASQQKELIRIFTEEAAKRKAAMAERKANREKDATISADEKFAMKNKMLDEKIAMKAKIKSVLTAEQMVKWEQMSAERKGKVKHQMRKKQEKKAEPKK